MITFLCCVATFYLGVALGIIDCKRKYGVDNDRNPVSTAD